MWVVVQHVPYDGAGGVTTALDRIGERAVHVRPFLGEQLPAAAVLTGLVVLGGPAGSADDDAPHLVAERRLIVEAVDRGVPVLGVCFGAQLLAVALGGGVRRARVPEVGMDVVRPTPAGAEDPVLGAAGAEIDVLQWHHDTIVPPPGSVTLATSDACDVQAFRHGARAYGTQFHVEIDEALADVVRPQMPGVVLEEAAVRRASRHAAAVLDRFMALR